MISNVQNWANGDYVICESSQGSYFPEDLRQISSYLQEDLRQITSSLVFNRMWQITPSAVVAVIYKSFEKCKFFQIVSLILYTLTFTGMPVTCLMPN